MTIIGRAKGIAQDPVEKPCFPYPGTVSGNSRRAAKAQRRRSWGKCAARPEGERGCFSNSLRLRGFAREHGCRSPFSGLLFAMLMLLLLQSKSMSKTKK
jgi:hypothetical protein